MSNVKLVDFQTIFDKWEKEIEKLNTEEAITNWLENKIKSRLQTLTEAGLLDEEENDEWYTYFCDISNDRIKEIK